MKFFELKKLVLGYFKSGVLRNILIVGVLTVLIKVLGFYKEIVISSTFGLSELLDTFFIAMLIPGFINSVFINAFGNVFIPNYIQASKAESNLKAFQTTGFIITIGLSAFFTLIAILFTDVFIELLFSGHSASYYELIKLQFYYVVPCIFIWGLGSLLRGLLYVNNEFSKPTLIGVITPISFIVCIYFFKEQLGQKVLAVSLLIGTFIQFLFVLFIAYKKKLIQISKPDFKNENIKTMLKQVPAKVSSGFLTGLIPVTDQYFAAKLAIGSIAALNYGLKIPAFLTTILVVSIGKVLLPHFSKLVVENKNKAFEKLFYSLKYLFLITSFTAISIIFASQWLVELLFEHGEFTIENTKTVSTIQIIFLIYSPFAVCGMVIVNFLTSLNKNNFMALVSLIGVTLNLVLDFIFMKYYGLYGIALCTTAVIIIRTLILFKYTVNLKRQLV